MSPATTERLVRYAWPGNLRELRNVLERAVILSTGPTLVLNELDDMRDTPVTAALGAAAGPTLVEIERAHILRVLEICAWRVRGRRNAAEQLGLNASTLYSRMQKLGIRRATSLDSDVVQQATVDKRVAIAEKSRVRSSAPATHTGLARVRSSSEVTQLAADITPRDRVLTHSGPEAKDARDLLRSRALPCARLSRIQASDRR